MQISRRKFIVLSAATASICARAAHGIESPTSGPSNGRDGSQGNGVIDTGPVDAYLSDKVYDAFRAQGVFVVRRDKQIFALSSVCTHKGCKVRVQDDESYLCKCHGSTFDRDGRVTNGPAKRDLPRLAVAEDTNRHLLVDPNQQLKV